MSAPAKRQLRRERPDEPVAFPAPSTEGIEVLRRLFPPVRAERRAS